MSPDASVRAAVPEIVVRYAGANAQHGAREILTPPHGEFFKKKTDVENCRGFEVHGRPAEAFNESDDSNIPTPWNGMGWCDARPR